MVIGKKAIYSGHVQGVGFRYTTQRLAADFPVTGYVRNLVNGTVELVAEGEAEQVDAFLSRVAQRMAGYVQKADISAEAVQGYKDFRIR